MKRLPILLIFFCASAFAQKSFEVSDGSKDFNVGIEVATCEAERCEGPVTFTLFRKGQTKSFQTFKLADSSFLVDEKQPANRALSYEKQSAFTFEDYNFDGVRDLALCDGNYSGYGGQSFQIYLFAPAKKIFVSSSGFTRLAQAPYLGIFKVDRKRRVLTNFSKSGCCLHQWEEYAVVNNRPRKIFEKTEDATDPAGRNVVTTTTSRLVNGRWRTRVSVVSKRGN
jgi:hypothetical protein